VSEAPALAPQELEALLKQDPLRRAQWMLNDLAAHECAWGLEDGQGWVIAKLATPIPGGPAYALPLWPRQECAALEAAGPGEQPRSIDLETLMEELLPEIGERGWGVLAFCVKNAGQAYKADEFSNQLADAWEALTEDPD
jgi:hypothetical protein